ncbi:MAG: citrate/2-methylcitrate synthase [Promethearchaeota archaeon]
MADVQKGLEGIVALETKIAYIDGIKGILEYRGIDINEIMKLSYDAVVYLLLYSKLPDENERAKFIKRLRNEREIDEGTINILRVCNFNIEAMDALRTAVSHLSHCDPDLNDNSLEANLRKGTALIAQFPTIVAAFWRIRNQKEPIPPDKTLSHGANFLYMLRGIQPTDLEAKCMEADFALSAEHELNASTFSVRTTASTLSDMHSAIISGLGTLKGVLHGGARLAILEMLDEIGEPEKAEDYVQNLISKNKRVPGFGHRVYKTFDPRGVLFKQIAKEIATNMGDLRWFSIAENIETTVLKEFVEKRGKPIYPNVDFYSGVLYKYLKIPPMLSTAVFAIGRIAGWVAHCIEQYADNRLIRPRAKYTGEHDLSISNQ